MPALKVSNHCPERRPVIIAARRTPVARAGSALADLPTERLLAPVIAAVINDARLNPGRIDDVIVGNAAGGGGNIARLALLEAGLPVEVPGMTVDRQCGAGLEAIVTAARAISAGAGEVYLAGGVESVSRAPWRVEKPRRPGDLPQFFTRAKFAPNALGDPDMGVAAENVARLYGVTRERQDAFAFRSHVRAVAAADAGVFRGEIVPIEAGSGRVVETDECPRRNTSLAALAELRAAFVPGGTVTAGNSCPLNDGAAMVAVVSEAVARRLDHPAWTVFLGAAAGAVDPNVLGIGPVPATRRLLERLPTVRLDKVDLIEFNEAFAAQVLASLDMLGIDEMTVNRDGGAIALGHPFGASGAILVTRLHAQMSIADAGRPLCGLAMLGIAGGLGLTAAFEHERAS